MSFEAVLPNQSMSHRELHQGIKVTTDHNFITHLFEGIADNYGGNVNNHVANISLQNRALYLLLFQISNKNIGKWQIIYVHFTTCVK